MKDEYLTMEYYPVFQPDSCIFTPPKDSCYREVANLWPQVKYCDTFIDITIPMNRIRWRIYISLECLLQQDIVRENRTL